MSHLHEQRTFIQNEGSKRMATKIIPGTIRCKFCNRIKSNAISDCLCSGKNKWPNPNSTRRTIKEARLKADGEIITPLSKQFLKAMRDKKKSNQLLHTPKISSKGQGKVKIKQVRKS